MNISSILGRRASLVAAAFGLLVSSVASATVVSFDGTTVSGSGIVSSRPNVTTFNFDNRFVPVYYQLSGGANISNPSPRQQPTGDTTPFLTTGPSTSGTITINLPQAVTYFGLNWGTMDAGNQISFISTTGVVENYTGAQIRTLGGLHTGDSAYVNFDASSGASWSQIQLSTTTPSFESDNHAFFVAPTPTPEPAAFVPVGLAIGLMITGLYRRRTRD